MHLFGWALLPGLVHRLRELAQIYIRGTQKDYRLL